MPSRTIGILARALRLAFKMCEDKTPFLVADHSLAILVISISIELFVSRVLAQGQRLM